MKYLNVFIFLVRSRSTLGRFLSAAYASYTNFYISGSESMVDSRISFIRDIFWEYFESRWLATDLFLLVSPSFSWAMI
jgi:hypothetical protein